MTTNANVVPLLTTREAAERLGLSMHTLRKMVKTGRLPAIMLTPRTMRFRQEDVEALIDGHATAKESA